MQPLGAIVRTVLRRWWIIVLAGVGVFLLVFLSGRTY